jgi:outer membrane protein OmpA-like peptidoglycan-associated protein
VDDVSLMEMTNVPDPPDSIISIGKDTLSNIPQGMPLILKHVLFEKNRANVLSSSYPDLDKLVDYLTLNTEYKIEISGHTDSTGINTVNKKLAEERAKQEGKYLVEKGINKRRIISFGYGAERPLFLNDTEEHKSLNRRVEVRFVK